MPTRTIAVDARPLARKMSGIRRYTEELLRLLVKDTDTQWLLYSDGEIEDNHGLARHENVEIYSLPTGRSSRFLWPWYSAKWLYKHHPDIFWSPRQHLPVTVPKGTILFLTIHDLVWMENRDTMPFAAYLSEKLLSRYSIFKAHYILPVSETTGAKIKKYFSSCKACLHVVTNGYRPTELVAEPRQVDALRDQEYFLTVGTHEPRKNYATLLEAYASYVASGGNKKLLIVGNSGWGVDVRQEIGKFPILADRVILLEALGDAELRWCYEHASAFVSVSLNEGFGIPLVEAQYFGVPLMVSDIEPYREIAGPTAVFFDPKDMRAIAKNLAISDQPEWLASHRSEKTRYSWETSAAHLQSLFRVAGSAKRPLS